MSSLELLLKGTPAPRGAVSRTEASDALEALWNKIDDPTKKCLTRQIRELVELNRGRDDLKRAQLAMIQLNLSPGDSALTVIVNDFMTILGEGRIDALREIKARAEEMSNERGADTAGSVPDVIMTIASMGGSDQSMESTSNKSTRSGESDDSMNSGKSDMSVEDKYPLSPNVGPNNEST